MLSEVDVNKNGQIELAEYLELMTNLKTGNVSSNRIAKLVEWQYNTDMTNKISVERSGGGL